MTWYRAVHPVDVAGRLARFALGTVTTVADTLIRGLTSAVVERLDLDDLVSRVDVNRVADRVDVDRVADRVDVNRVAERVEVDLVAQRVDVDRIAARLNLDAVLARIDLVVLTRDVLEEIDLGRIVRDTGGGMAEDTVYGLRARSMRADRMVNRLADRLLHRPDIVPGPADEAGPPHERTP
ncbi:hypothetical protein OHS59_37325 [Streptomyces sp. NBC_00414]|uniref:hypothetical protein n=1 Tax=Streptomyces sp. NBC_00414 TaxID=2975739 RepID=UPI002E20E78D